MIETRESRQTERSHGNLEYRQPVSHNRSRRLGKTTMALLAAAGITVGAIGLDTIYNGIRKDLHIGLPNIHLPKTGPTPATGKSAVIPETYKTVALKTPVCTDTLDVDAGVQTNSNYQVFGITTGGSNANALLPIRFDVCAKDALAANAVVEAQGSQVQSVQVNLPANYVPQSAGPDVLSDVMCLGLPAHVSEQQIIKAQTAYVHSKNQVCKNNLIDTHGVTGMATNNEAFDTTLLALRLATLAGEITPLPAAQYNQWQSDEKNFYQSEVKALYPHLSPSQITINTPLAESPAQQLATNLQPLLGELHTDFSKMQFKQDHQETDFSVSAKNASGEVVLPVSLNSAELSSLNGML